jgi:GAF domain-containing protein
LEVKGGVLRLIDEESGILKRVASYGLSDTYLNKGALHANQSIPEVLHGKPVYIKNAASDPRIEYPEAMVAEGIAAVLSVPVVAAEKVMGVLRLYSAEQHNYTEEDIEFVSALAEMGGMAIVNARQYQDKGEKLAALFDEIGVELPLTEEACVQELETTVAEPLDSAKNLDYFRTLHEVTSAVLSTLDSKEVIQLIVDKVVDIMQVKAGALRLRNETTHELELIATRGLSDQFLAKGQPHTNQSISETLAGRPVLITDTANDPRLEYPVETVAEGIASILSMPIIAQKRVVGVLRLYSADVRQYSKEEITFLSALAEIAGVGIVNARMYEKTRNDLSFWTTTLGYMQD